MGPPPSCPYFSENSGFLNVVSGLEFLSRGHIKALIISTLCGNLPLKSLLESISIHVFIYINIYIYINVYI